MHHLRRAIAYITLNTTLCFLDSLVDCVGAARLRHMDRYDADAEPEQGSSFPYPAPAAPVGPALIEALVPLSPREREERAAAKRRHPAGRKRRGA